MHNLVPHFVLRQHELGKKAGSFYAAALFVDISGFTIITETLMRHGTAGAETLANLMRTVFTPLIDSIYLHGGYIIGFAGDAFTAVFPTTHHVIITHAPAAQRAVSAAILIQQTTASQDRYETPFGSFEISSKIGVDMGQIEWGIIGNEAEPRAAYYFRGAAIDGCSLAEHQAARGDLIISAAVAEAVRSLTAVVTQQIGSYYRVLPTNPPPHILSDRFTPHFDSFGTIATQYYPTDTLYQTHLGEFRQVINVFIGLEKNPAPADLEAFVQLVFEHQKIYGGLLNRIDFGDKGCHLLFFWGAPTAYENDVSRVLNFLLDLQANSDITFRAAVTYALAYAGFIGSDLREEYTCYGQGINLAARFLMQAEWGSIWLDSAIAQRATPQFSVDFIEQFTLKGFAAPQSAFALQAHRLQIAQSLFRGEMIGREQELAQIGQAIQPIWQGEFGGVVSIIGEAGLGKSRLLHEFVKILSRIQKDGSENENESPRIFFCQTDEIIRQSLNPFRYFLRRYFNQHTNNSDADNKSQFSTVLENLIAKISHLEEGEETGIELDRSQSFLGALVDLHWPDSLYAQLDSKLRFDNTLRALKNLFIAESLHQPFIIQLEDSHWLDADSETFLSLLTRNVTSCPFAIISTTRPPEVETTLFTQQLSPEVPCTTIHLSALDAKQVQLIAENILVGRVAPDLVEQLVRRAGGNPFFAEQMVLYLKEQALLVVGLAGWQLADAQQDTLLPDDLRTVLVARLDRLTRSVRQVVQTASVLGREFPLTLLSAMLKGMERVEEKVETAVSAAIWIALSEIRYLFKHGLMRDAAYEMQLHHQRRQLHHMAATSLETLHEDDLKPHYPDIAYHFEQGGNVDKAHIYLIMAGNAAKDAYQNHQALNYYERALVLTPSHDLQTRFELLSAREETLDLMGSRLEQKKSINELKKLAEAMQQPDRQIRAALRQSRWAESTSDFELAVTSAKQAIHTAETALSGMVGKRFIALGEIALGEAYMRLGNYAATEPRLINAVNILDQSNDRKEATNGRKVLASLYIYLSQYAKSEKNYHAALNDYRTRGDRFGEATILGRLGLLARMQAKQEKATMLFEEAIALQKQIGDRYGEGMATLNLGAVLQVQGNLPGAQAAFTQALFILRDIDHRVGEGSALNGMGWVARDTGDFATSIDAYQQALTILQSVGDRFGAAVTLSNVGTVYHYEGKLDKAQAVLQQAVDQQQAIDDLRGMGLTLIYLGATELARGKRDAAKAAFQQAFDAMEKIAQTQHVMEAAAGLARVALAEQELLLAQRYTDSMLTYMEGNPSLGGTVFPFRIWMACYQVLTAVDDPRRHTLLTNTMQTLQARANHFADEAERVSFLKTVPDHLEVVQAWKAATGQD
jgi:predicted ATPase/class 3 adenylate cyclase